MGVDEGVAVLLGGDVEDEQRLGGVDDVKGLAAVEVVVAGLVIAEDAPRREHVLRLAPRGCRHAGLRRLLSHARRRSACKTSA